MRKNRAIVYIMMWICCSVVSTITVIATKQFSSLSTMTVPLAFMLLDYMFFGGRK